ncbi:MAG: serine/threonine-protein kinase [Planctomycetota bacterium]|jgi:serine/threonine-protein kinase
MNDEPGPESAPRPDDVTRKLKPEARTAGSGSGVRGSEPLGSPEPGTPNPEPQQLGEFAGYRIESEIGRGGMGVVYRAFDPKLKRTVALKVLLSAEHASEEEIRRFFREAESAAKLQHPNIVPIHDLQVHEGRHFYTMDYIEGEPLDTLINDRRLDARNICEIMERVALGLEEAHRQGIVHRDLKPANIIVAPDGQPKITDFGLAKVIASGEAELTQAGLTGSGVAMGTPHYEAPEQAAGRSSEVDARTDVYALGCILYELLTGVPPFVAASAMEVLRMQVEEDPVSPNRRGAKVPPDVATICLTCLEKEPRPPPTSSPYA